MSTDHAAYAETPRVMPWDERERLLQSERGSEDSFGNLVGRSAALRAMVQQIDLVAPTDATVLILGESGTGKELVAREIHERSRRRSRALVRVNCASIPRELYESEFFGHVKGAFTGALKDRAGRFESANGGTLFLDEVGEIPLELQSKLLRVLQEGEYERVGEETTRTVNVRIVAATNRDLTRDVQAGRFRQDLYYRLNVYPIPVVPLRHRKEDIPLLAAYFVEQAAERLHCPRPDMAEAQVRQLQFYDWPGNVRELQNVIERAVIASQGRALEFELPHGTHEEQPVTRPIRTAARSSEGEVLTEAEMRQWERDNLLAALHLSHWRIYGPGGAAERLGVKPTTLVSRIKKLGIKKPD
ncbi:MAG: sigma-54 interaction domain-containing protein [Nitrospiraceae bacterium]